MESEMEGKHADPLNCRQTAQISANVRVILHVATSVIEYSRKRKLVRFSTWGKKWKPILTALNSASRG